MAIARFLGPNDAGRWDSEIVCAILDKNVAGLVFGARKSRAGREFYDWLDSPRARLVVGGTLYDELVEYRRFEKWAEVAIADGRLRPFTREEIEAEMAELSTKHIRSNDPFVIALARVAKARILYSDDGDLRDDFRDRTLVPNPRGRLYPMGDSENASRRRRNLLRRDNLCPNW